MIERNPVAFCHLPRMDGVEIGTTWTACAICRLPPPNGSRLSCGRLARRRKSSGRTSVPARAQHSDSFRAITARQLQALVRQLALAASFAGRVLAELSIFGNAREVSNLFETGHRRDRIRDEPPLAGLDSCPEESLEVAQ